MDEVKKEKCEVCGKAFTMQADLDKHMQEEHPQQYQELRQRSIQ